MMKKMTVFESEIDIKLLRHRGTTVQEQKKKESKFQALKP